MPSDERYARITNQSQPSHRPTRAAPEPALGAILAGADNGDQHQPVIAPESPGGALTIPSCPMGSPHYDILSGVNRSALAIAPQGVYLCSAKDGTG